MDNKFYSPLRYPGGKTKLAPFIKALFYENRLVGCNYVEPFAGGAGVALSLLFDEYVSTITINDFDPSIYAFWHSVVHRTHDFCKAIESASLTVEMWRRQKRIQCKKDTEDLFGLGFSTFYLNRTNVSGIVKGGIIGGMGQKGKYSMKVRFNKTDLINRISRIGEYRDRIKVCNLDAIKLLPKIEKGNFVYLDPPYVRKAKDLYMNYYSQDDHRRIAEFLYSKNLRFCWLLSYDQDELIERLYASCKIPLKWNLGYGASNRISKEYLFASKNLKTDVAVSGVFA